MKVEKAYGEIDYNALVESKSTTIGLGTKIGVGAAIIVFGLVFALDEFLPSGRHLVGKERAIPMACVFAYEGLWSIDVVAREGSKYPEVMRVYIGNLSVRTYDMRHHSARNEYAKILKGFELMANLEVLDLHGNMLDGVQNEGGDDERSDEEIDLI
ncbi:hypothetical protein FXO37_11080 [Capsicum annuum]|nr:hypothetical protein FXO37_11080 [Capsicum annuum]